MPVEFISATHITPAPSAHGHNLAGFDPDYTRRFARMLDDPPEWAAQPLPEVTRVGPQIAWEG